MIRDFESYVDEGLAVKQRPDPGEAESLSRKAGKRLKYIKSQKITDETASFIFEDVYEALREAAHALMALKGYKPLSHEAVIAFLIKFYHFPESDISSLDRYRILRNRTVYSAEKVSKETCEAALNFLEEFFPKLEREFEKAAEHSGS